MIGPTAAVPPTAETLNPQMYVVFPAVAANVPMPVVAVVRQSRFARRRNAAPAEKAQRPRAFQHAAPGCSRTDGEQRRSGSDRYETTIVRTLAAMIGR